MIYARCGTLLTPEDPESKREEQTHTSRSRNPILSPRIRARLSTKLYLVSGCTVGRCRWPVADARSMMMTLYRQHPASRRLRIVTLLYSAAGAEKTSRKSFFTLVKERFHVAVLLYIIHRLAALMNELFFSYFLVVRRFIFRFVFTNIEMYVLYAVSKNRCQA